MRGKLALLAIGLLVFGAVVMTTFAGNAAGSPEATPAAALTPVTGNITGPTVVATGATVGYLINGTGGPATSPNATREGLGVLTFYASVSATNLTGVTISPATAKITNNRATETNLTLGPTVEVVTINVEITSVFLSQNMSTNFSYPVHVVTPYTVRAELVASSSTAVLAFPVQIDLDGRPVATITVPALNAGATYNLTFAYPTLGLPAGEHTFSISLVDEHGLVTFANGATVYSTSFYIPGPPTNYIAWYILGVVAFFGALFIFMTRVAARRRGALRK